MSVRGQVKFETPPIPTTVDQRLKSYLETILDLGYSRVRLYVLSADGQYQIGRMHLGEDLGRDFRSIRLPITGYPTNDWLIKHKQPKIWNKEEIGPEMFFESVLKKEKVKEWLDVPAVTENGLVIGKFSIDNKILDEDDQRSEVQPPKITEAHFDQLMQIGRYVAIILKEEKDHLAIVDEARVLRGLLELNDQLSRVNSVDEDIKTAIGAIYKLLKDDGVIGCHMRLIEQGALVLKHGEGPYFDEWNKFRQDINLDDPNSIAMKAIGEQGPFYVDNTDNDPFWNWLKASADVPKDFCDSVKSYGAYPLEIAGVNRGAILVYSDRLGFLTEVYRKSLRALCERVAIEVERDEAFAKLNAAREEIRSATRRAAQAATHNFGTPLFLIYGVLYMLRDLRVYPEKNLHVIPIIISRLKKISDLLDEYISQYNSFWDASRASRRQINLTQLIKDTAELGLLEGRSVNLDLQENIAFEGDPTKLRDLFIELFRNAATHTNLGDLVGVSARDEEGQIIIRIADSGKGVPYDMKEAIFFPHVKSSHRGTGLGLPISREIVQAHSGTIIEEGIPTNGAVFKIVFRHGEGN